MEVAVPETDSQDCELIARIDLWKGDAHESSKSSLRNSEWAGEVCSRG